MQMLSRGVIEPCLRVGEGTKRQTAHRGRIRRLRFSTDGAIRRDGRYRFPALPARIFFRSAHRDASQRRPRSAAAAAALRSRHSDEPIAVSAWCVTFARARAHDRRTPNAAGPQGREIPIAQMRCCRQIAAGTSRAGRRGHRPHADASCRLPGIRR